MRPRALMGLFIPALVAMNLAGCGGCGTSSGSPTIVKLDGSSTVYPVAQALAEEFQNSKGGAIKVTVGISGTGGGFKKFCRGETDISNASRPIRREEIEDARKAGIEYIELPICFDALTVVVHPQNDWVKTMSVAELKKIWEPAAQGALTHWNQIRPEWPNEKIHLFGAGSDSGTFDYFTEAVVGHAKSSRGDFTASEDDNVLVRGIEGNKNALGYLPYAYYAPNSSRLKAVPIEWDKNHVKEAVMPTLENVLKGTYNPLSRPLFIYVNARSANKPEVAEFVEFFMTAGPALVREIRYLPLPDHAYAMGLERFRKRQIGTGFAGGSEVGMPVEEILKRTPQS
jgi:phosphate transport system substrate-binding protein